MGVIRVGLKGVGQGRVEKVGRGGRGKEKIVGDNEEMGR